MNRGTARVIRGNALNLPIADSTVDLVVTSPPYFGLRSYQDGGAHYAGQIGSEATPTEFVDALLAATAEMVRVLKPSGSIFVNLGDKYAGGGSGPQGATGQRVGRSSANEPYFAAGRARKVGLRDKSLIGIPWRYAIRCIDELGLILRAEIVWSKPNGLPESVTDRVRRSHETWFHFTTHPRYYSAVDEIREPYDPASVAHAAKYSEMYSRKRGMPVGDVSDMSTLRRSDTNPLGKLPGSVWTIPTQPLQVPASLGVDHFAAFPMEWPRRFILGWSPSGICTVCGEGRRPVTVQERTSTEALRPAYGGGKHGTGGSTLGPRGVLAHITGESCACPDTSAPITPATVLDPFGGTGTTALVAKMLGRDGISVDMSSDYCRLAEWRTTDPGQMAAAAGVPKVDSVHPDQMDLFGEAI